MNESIQVAGILIALLGAGSVIGVAIKALYDNGKDAAVTHDTVFTKGWTARDAEVDGLRRSFEQRFAELEERIAAQDSEIRRQRKAIIRLVGWVKDEHREEAFQLLVEFGMPDEPITQGETPS